MGCLMELIRVFNTILYENEFQNPQMGCPALGIWVAFLKQPEALPGRAPQKNKNHIFLNYF
jgi:hypothetical protein